MNKEKLKKIFTYVLVIYCALAVSFYFLAGDQIRYRQSRSEIQMLEPNQSTQEIVVGRTVTQNFVNLVDRLKTVSFKITTFYRTNVGTLHVELTNGSKVLMKKDVDISKLEEGEVITLESDKYLSGYTGKLLTLTFTSTSVKNKGIAILTNGGVSNGSYTDTGAYVNGILCFSTTGQEYIFTGQYYWYMVLGFGIVLTAILYVSYKNYIDNKKNYLIVAINAISRYQFLIHQLVLRDFKTKYKRSVLGVLWSFLNPLLTMLVQYFVFSNFFKTDIENYQVYLLIGVICYSFFSEATSMCLSSISSNDKLITKVYVPKYIFPLSRTISSSINLIISIVPLLLVCLLTGLAFKQSALLALFFFVCLMIFVLGFGMILATLMVFFRDIQFLWSVICMIWMYATPIFYPAAIIPPKYSFIQTLNPLYQCIKNIRICLIDGISPEPRAYAYSFALALFWLLLGSFIFKKEQDKFTLYL
ncbi:MAG: ABC transporter permease [Erysipelotrichaceae bacterium]|nr:ABC transporter permease [Erysipelotrichaceae bacterium]